MEKVISYMVSREFLTYENDLDQGSLLEQIGTGIQYW